MIVTVIILSITTIVFLYTTINLLRKNEAHEDVVVEQEELIAEIAKKVDESMARMKDIDKLGSFEADDETGYIFKNLYEVIEDLEKYYGTQEEE